MCANFHFNRIYLKISMEGGPFQPPPLPPLALERPKKPGINRVNIPQYAETWLNFAECR